ncbi:MAG TPA: hypothetical protein VGH20_19930 [Myxococcales bacterium]
MAVEENRAGSRDRSRALTEGQLGTLFVFIVLTSVAYILVQRTFPSYGARFVAATVVVSFQSIAMCVAYQRLRPAELSVGLTPAPATLP